jgi:hypothetical protein
MVPRPAIGIFVILTVAPKLASAEKAPEVPRISPDTVAAQIIGGGFGAVAGGATAYLVSGGRFTHAADATSDRDYPRLVVTGLGLTLGAALITNAFGDDDDVEASLGAACVGAAAGTVVTVSIREAVRPRNLAVWSTLTLSGPAIGATLGSTLFRRPKRRGVAPIVDGGIYDGFALPVAQLEF